MGGTSFDVSTVIEGQIATTRDGRISDHPTGVSAVQILTLGAGGGSIASVDEGGLLCVGPNSAGAQPGPACYGRGGVQPTVSDAYLALGFLDADRFLGGRMKLSVEAAKEAIRTYVAEPLGIDVTQAAHGICRVVNERMVNGIREMTVRRGIDPRQLVLVTAGGATGIAAVELARELSIDTIIVPRETSVLCAYGAVNADLVWTSVGSFPTRVGSFDLDGVNRMLKGLVDAGTGFLDRLQVPDALRTQTLYTAARYPMQVTEIEVVCPDTHIEADDVDVLARAFHAAHLKRYAVEEPGSDVEFVMWRAVARGVTRPVRHADRPVGKTGETTAVLAHRPIYDMRTQRFADASVIDPELLEPGRTVTGPALLVATDTTIVLPADARAVVRDEAYIVIELRD
jgi:N-methylhydantoinase A